MQKLLTSLRTQKIYLFTSFYAKILSCGIHVNQFSNSISFDNASTRISIRKQNVKPKLQCVITKIQEEAR